MGEANEAMTKTLYLVLLLGQDPEDARWVSYESMSTFLDPHSIIATYHP